MFYLISEFGNIENAINMKQFTTTKIMVWEELSIALKQSSLSIKIK